MPGVNKKPTSKSFNAVTIHRRSAHRLCTSAPRPTGSCYGTKPTRGTLDLHHSRYNDTKLTRKSVTYVVELKCYPCEWRAQRLPPPCIQICVNLGRECTLSDEVPPEKCPMHTHERTPGGFVLLRRIWIDIREYRVI